MRFLAFALPVALVGCYGGTPSTTDPALDPNADPDGDGLSNAEEEVAGLDPSSADTDGDGLVDGDEGPVGADPLDPDTDDDGLVDGDEIANGADPTLVDTDDDGYTDRDEVYEGHDPADPKDRIYEGRWPYYFEKDDLGGGNVDGSLEPGRRFARLQLRDQHGDRVDLFDFYNDDVPVVIDVSTQWCPPCNALASWLDGGMDSAGYGQVWPAGPDVIARGDVYWITVLTQDNSGQPADRQVAEAWYDLYPNRKIPVLADDTTGDCSPATYRMSETECYIDLGFWPSGALLKPNLDVDQDSPSDNDIVSILYTLADRYPE